MACKKAVSDSEKEEHLRLAEIIKGTHAELRKHYKKDPENFENVWKDHCSDQELLSKYANAMHNLAKNHWSKLPQTRVDWCKNIILEYFHEGGIIKAVEREIRKNRKRLKLKEEARNEIKQQDLDTTNSHGKCFQYEKEQELTEGCNSIDTHFECTLFLLDEVLGKDEKIRILDVGSCFNPFSSYDQFLSIGIDISPATENVLLCDFLQLQTGSDIPRDSIQDYLHNLKGPITSLPRATFHAVVFSLLLEYMPSPIQRWTCCQKAHKLLCMNGLLLIITPDSHKQHRNANMIKSWRTALEFMGFSHWRYVKLEHLHCIAYRKVTNEVANANNEVTPDFLFIPQDFKCEEKEEEEEASYQYTEEDQEFFLKTLEDLPMGFDYN